MGNWSFESPPTNPSISAAVIKFSATHEPERMKMKKKTPEMYGSPQSASCGWQLGIEMPAPPRRLPQSSAVVTRKSVVKEVANVSNAAHRLKARKSVNRTFAKSASPAQEKTTRSSRMMQRTAKKFRIESIIT